MSSDSENQAPELRFTSEFKRNIRQLAKKYRRIKIDLQPILDALQGGEKPGDEIPGTGEEWTVFKVRAANSDSGKGKSGGYRVVYGSLTTGPVVLITVYSKSEQGDIRPDAILQIIKTLEEVAENDDAP